MVLYFVMDVLRDLPGLPGLFVACLFSGALRYQPDFVRTVPPIIIFYVFLDVDIDFLSLNGVQFLTAQSHLPSTPWQQLPWRI